MAKSNYNFGIQPIVASKVSQNGRLTSNGTVGMSMSFGKDNLAPDVFIAETNLNNFIKTVSTRLCLIADCPEHSTNVTLNAAFEEYKKIEKLSIDPKLQAAYDQYMIVKKLTS